MSAAPKTPVSGTWTQGASIPRLLFRHLVFDSVAGVRVLSSVDFIAAQDSPTGQPRHEYHLSISERGGRASRECVNQVLVDFGLVGANEDNHTGPNGVARHFWLPVVEGQVIECPCQKDEPVHDEGGDYRWREAPGLKTQGGA